MSFDRAPRLLQVALILCTRISPMLIEDQVPRYIFRVRRQLVRNNTDSSDFRVTPQYIRIFGEGQIGVGEYSEARLPM